MAHNTYTWSTGDIVIAGTVGTKSFNNTEHQYVDVFNDLNTWFTANGLTVNAMRIVNTNGYVKAQKNVGTSVVTSTNPSLPAGTQVVVPFDSEEFDPNNYFNTTSHVFYCPVAGKYRISAQLCFTSVSSVGTVQILKNSSLWRYTLAPISTVTPTCVSIETVGWFSANDQICIVAVAAVTGALSGGGMMNLLSIELVSAD